MKPQTKLASQSEASLQAQLVEAAERLGWKVFVVRKSAVVSTKTGRVYSVVTAKGWPDVFVIRGARIMVFECKNERGKVTPEQREWLDSFKQARITEMVVRPNTLAVAIQLLGGTLV